MLRGLFWEGEDSPETIGVKGLAEKPANHRLYGTSMRWKEGSFEEDSARAK
jgi:hypothetical protein